MRQDRRGTLYLVGLGPGAPGLLTPEAASALEAADTVVGYRGYLELVADRLAGKEVVGRELGQEVERAQVALELAESGRTVALVSSGDAGVYGMGGLACELAARRGSRAELVVVPGVTAALAAAARLGAPLAHDWAAISLSDLLTPWPEILRRVEAAAQADFVLVFYNPASRGRSTQLGEVARRLLAYRAPDTPIGLVESAYRPGERVEVRTLGELAASQAGVTMFTTVIVGSSRTFTDRGRMVTPRIYAAKAGSDSDGRDPGADGVEAEARPEPHPRQPPGDRILAESLAIIDRELGPHPADPAERAVVRRIIHASADFSFAETLRFRPGALEAAVSALRRGAAILTDVEMLRAGLRRDLAGPLGVSAACLLGEPETDALAASAGLTRSAAGLRRGAERLGDGAVVAIGNAPTALEECLDRVERDGWRPACIVGLPVGFVGVVEAKRRLWEQRSIPCLTNTGRKGGSAVTAAAMNALLELAADGPAP